MKIIIGDRKLEKILTDERRMIKTLGALRTEKLNLRLAQMSAAVTLEDLKHVAGKYHELLGNRKGYWACDLDQPYRLIFKPIEDPIPVNDDGQYIWTEITGVCITEITNYHE